MTSVAEGPPRNTAKGKARALPEDLDERTPLLASGSIVQGDLESNASIRRQQLFSKLLRVFLFTCIICGLLLLVIILIAYSYGSRASGISSEELLQRALVARGPDRVDVLNVTSEGGIWVNVRGRVGLDAGRVIDVDSEEDDSVLEDLWKSLGRWGIHQLDRVSVKLTTIEISSEHDHLANLTVPAFEIPLTADPPADDSWLTKLSTPIYIQPTRNVSALLHFARESWRDGMIHVAAHVSRAAVHVGHVDEGGWRSKLQVIRSDVRSKVTMKVPHVPGLPSPGHNNPLPEPSRLVTLQSFRIESEDSRLFLFANATAVNPAPTNLHYDVPRLPFTIALPSLNDSKHLVSVASIHTSPFPLTHPNISLAISGHVLPLRQDASPILSEFIANYVSARDSEVVISSPLFPDIAVPAIFPALRPKPQILRDVTIRNMRIRTDTGGAMLASGTVFAHVVLPRGFRIGLNVTRVLPDVLVYDGEVPPDDESAVDHSPDAPPPPPLPDPLPARAFGHIRPEDWLPSTSISIETSPDEGTGVEVLASIVDVPIEVLPGRDREFRNFVGKVIFSSKGALAGVQGVAAVAAHVAGLPVKDGTGEMELTGLPFRGSVRIGKSTLLTDVAA